MKTFLSSFFVLVTVVLSACSATAQSITNFDECVAAGNRVLRSYPAKCVTADGQTFIQKVEKHPDILELPTPGGEGMCRNQCGNGSCEMMVCMGQGCPCAENSTTCPQDCQ